MSNIRALMSIVLISSMLIAVGMLQSWSLALSIVNMCLISSIMALGVNIQWGFAGLFNVGIMGFAALGGAAAVLVSKAPVKEAWSLGWQGLLMSLLALAACVFIIRAFRKAFGSNPLNNLLTAALVVASYFAIRFFYIPAVTAIESVDPAATGYLGGLGLPIVLSWGVGGLLAALAALLVGKIALGLRSDYLAIATLGISEIIVAMVKNEDWLTRGVKNVSGLERPVPYEVNLQKAEWFIELVKKLHATDYQLLDAAARQQALNQWVIDGSSIFVKLCYAALFLSVLIVIYILSERALRSPWGRMMRAIRDNEAAASAMGKNVTRRHLQVFVLGSAVVGIAGAMMTTLDGQFTPGTYNPLRFTFLIWVMVIVGGSGNNLGSIVGGFLIWFFWIEAEPLGLGLVELLTLGLEDGNALKSHLLNNAAHMRLVFMGMILLLVLRFSPRGLLPEKTRY